MRPKVRETVEPADADPGGAAAGRRWFDPSVAGLKAVREALPTENPWAVLNFLVRRDSRLDGRGPIDLLRDGQVDVVLQAARGMGEQGA